MSAEPAVIPERCTVCGADSYTTELFGIHSKDGSGTKWFCGQHRKSYADVRLPARVLSAEALIELAEHADAIRAHGKRVVRDVIAIGDRLTKAKALCGHSFWLPWLEQEFAWDERTARRYMSVSELALKSDNVSDLEVPISGLYLLASPNTPDEARETVIAAASAGEKITVATVREAIASAKQPTTTTKPAKTESREQAPPTKESRYEAIVSEIVQLFRQLDWTYRSKALDAIDRLYADWGVEKS